MDQSEPKSSKGSPFLKNIPKFFVFVILLAVVSAGLLYLIRVYHPASSGPEGFDAAYSVPEIVGRFAYAPIRESSGLAVSHCQDGVLWTHNDSGDLPLIYAAAPDGRHLGVWRVEGAEHIDWEDIALTRTQAGSCVLYIGEIGNNDRKRPGGIIYRFPEPVVSAEAASSTREAPLTTERADALAFTYPGPPHDAEALIVHPKTGVIYIVTKEVETPASVYRIEPRFEIGEVNAEPHATVSLPSVPNGLVTAGDISPDGQRLILTDYVAGYEFAILTGDPDLKNVWGTRPTVVDLGERTTGESAAYGSDGRSILSTGEMEHSPIFRVTAMPQQ